MLILIVGESGKRMCETENKQGKTVGTWEHTAISPWGTVYSAGTLKWPAEELKLLCRSTWKRLLLLSWTLIEDKGKKKVEKQQDLKRDATRLSDVRKMLVNPAGVDALGFV